MEFFLSGVSLLHPRQRPFARLDVRDKAAGRRQQVAPLCFSIPRGSYAVSAGTDVVNL